MNDKIGIVLIHGAGLGSFVWNDINPYFKYPVLHINFPNREVGEKANENTSFDDYLKLAIKQIGNWNVNEIAIIAHSIGGCLGLKLNDHFKNKVKVFIGISTIIPQMGKSFTDCFPFPQRLILPIILSLFGTKPPDKSIKSELCNDLAPSKSAEIIKKFTPESKKLYTTKINYNSLPEKCLYIKLTNDNALSQTIQSEMIKNLNCKNVIQLESGHLAMISKPKELANTINNFIEKETL